ncbi:DUF2799 domain-containing protein [Endozoicomonas montiporae]|uniref:Lipoprotein n=1 Tax=Endozoicomonas montiporae CL-33 TaxID=570277 RepID=A0A142BHX3_9GAMM|nr:DUF2799 domain-containing protein [Endozoicomonas montiporae]AMO58349.1 hypothetical protein EZMO1_4433 [Endozoicomonas montiporae CL-33]
MKQFALALALSTLAIAGCSTTPSPQQLASDGSWEQLGQMDGYKGLSERTHSELSELHQLNEQNFDLYKKGYDTGIAEFCSFDTGYFLGRSGFSYRGQCAGFDHEDEYILSWQDGQFEYDNARWDQDIQDYDLETFYGVQ